MIIPSSQSSEEPSVSLMSAPELAAIERAHPFEPIRKLKHFGIGQGLACIAVTGLPVLLHGAPRELKILGDTFIGPGAINQMHDVADLVIGFGEQTLGIGALAQLLGHLFEQISECNPQLLKVLISSGGGAVAAGIDDLLLPYFDCNHVLGQF